LQPQASIGSFLVLVAVTASSGARAQSIERICSGQFTDMRVIGLTLGDCDLNSISDKEINFIKRMCGEPWNPSDNSNRAASKCKIRVIASPTKSIPPENHGYGSPPYHVRNVVMTERK
jgi:hypothetical protein